MNNVWKEVICHIREQICVLTCLFNIVGMIIFYPLISRGRSYRFWSWDVQKYTEVNYLCKSKLLFVTVRCPLKMVLLVFLEIKGKHRENEQQSKAYRVSKVEKKMIRNALITIFLHHQDRVKIKNSHVRELSQICFCFSCQKRSTLRQIPSGQILFSGVDLISQGGCHMEKQTDK